MVAVVVAAAVIVIVDVEVGAVLEAVVCVSRIVCMSVEAVVWYSKVMQTCFMCRAKVEGHLRPLS